MADQGSSQWRGKGQLGVSRVQPTGAPPDGGEGSYAPLASDGPVKSLIGGSAFERVRTLVLGAAGPFSYSLNVGDIITVLEALSTLQTTSEAVSDTAAASDALAEVYGAQVAAADTSPAQETLVVEFDPNVDASETIPAADAVATQQVTAEGVSDTAALSEALTASIGVPISVSDTAALVDAVGLAQVLQLAAGDTAPVLEALSALTQTTVVLNDTAVVNEALTAIIGLTVSAADVAAVVDAVGLVRTAQLAIGEPVTVLEALSLIASGAVAIGDTAAASDGMTAGVGVVAAVSDPPIVVTDSVIAGSVSVDSTSDTGLLVTFLTPLQLVNVIDPLYFDLEPLDGGVPVGILTIVPQLNLGGYVTSLLVTITKPTNAKRYRLTGHGLKTQVGQPFVFKSDFVAVSSQPKVESVTFQPDDGSVVVVFDQAMRSDGAFTDPAEYSIAPPVQVVSVRALDDRSVLLRTLGFSAGSHTLTVNATGTPKDVAGNPIDPVFNQAIFSAAVPLAVRSVFTDRGPIAKPPLTIQTGTGVVIADPVNITLTGGLLPPSVVGLYLTLGSNATNGGTFQITAWIAPTQIRIKGNLHLPDAQQGVTTWEVYDPRNGEIADDPADVEVRVNSLPVAVEAVIGLLGQIVLAAAPGPADDVKADYSFLCNPTVEVRRFNSKEFRFNAWNRDQGYPNDASGHHYRYNNVMISPSDFVPADMQAKLDQPLQRDLKYRAYERAYSALMNDPNLLLFNAPHHKIAYPQLQRTIEGSFVNYQPTALPEAYPATPWVRKGSGAASLVFNRLVVGDTTGGPFPAGDPIFWTRPIDLTFPHVYAMTWQTQVDSVTAFEGVWTGVAAGFSGELKAVVVGYLEVAGVKQIGVLKKGFGNDPSQLAAWTGGLDGSNNPTGLPTDLDWTILHGIRVFESDGVVRVYFDGGIVESLRVLEDELPFLEELNDPFNQAQNAYFGSLSRPAQNQSTWDFVRYAILPTNPLQTAPSIFVSYEGNDLPEGAVPPWTPVGYHGTERVVASQYLQVDSTSATDAATEALVELIGGDFRGFLRQEPLLAVSSDVILDVNVQLLTHTHGIAPNAVMAAIDDGDRLLQLSFFPDKAAPKFSYGGRSFPEDFQPTPWASLGTAPVAMWGRTLRITDDSIADGRVYYRDDTAGIGTDERIVAVNTDYILEFRCQVRSYTPDPGGFAGVMGEIYDGARVLGLLLLEVAGVTYVAPHSEGNLLPGPVQWAFAWNDGQPHTYRMVRTGASVTFLVDGQLLGVVPYVNFTGVVGPAAGTISWGSSTVASMMARSEVDWMYANVWRVLSGLRHYVGFWRGTDPDQLTGYHLPLKTSGRGAVVVGNTLQDTAADFVVAGVVAGDQLVIDVGGNKGTYEVVGVFPTQLTIAAVWPVQPSLVAYRVPLQVDWTAPHKYRLVRSPDGATTLLLDSQTQPLIAIGYNEIDLPPSSVGVPRIIAGGLPSITWGAFDPTNLSSSLWDFVRYGITRSPTELRIAPHHQILNQRNVMASPEHLRTTIPHPHTDFWSSDTGIPPQTDPDFLKNPLLVAYTLLNEGTPLVPLTQSTEVQVPTPTTQFVSAFNRPEDLLNNDGDFTFNDGSVRHILLVPDDVLYTSLTVIETQTGEKNLLTPFCDTCEPQRWALNWTKEVCLTYDGSVLPENAGNTPNWELVSDVPANVQVQPFSGVLTYETTGPTRTVYRNPTSLPDSLSLATEVKIRMKVLQDTTLGLGDSQVRLGFSSTAGFTLSLAFVTTPLGERYVLLVDQNTLAVLGGIPFNWYDGNFHEYRMVRDPSTASVLVYVDS